jgi:hypothetical protein
MTQPTGSSSSPTPPSSGASSSAAQPSTAAAELPAALVAAWQQSLAAEHAAIFGYGLVGAHAGAAIAVGLVQTCAADHEVVRDRAWTQLRVAGITPVTGRASYPLPFAVTDAPSAWRYAVTLEQNAATAWRYLLAQALATAPSAATTPLRTTGLTELTAAARRALRWRALIDPATATVPFPGL